MSIRKRYSLHAVAPAMALTLALTACGSDAEEETTGGTDTAEVEGQDGQEPAGDDGQAAPEDDEPAGQDSGDEASSEGEESGGDDAGAGDEPATDGGDAVTVALGEPSGPVRYASNWEFDATVERFEAGSWDDLAGSPAAEEDRTGYDPYYVTMSLTNESDTPYEGGFPSRDVRVRADDGGPFETVEAMNAENLPDWCDYSSPAAATLIEPGETVSECQVVLVGHGVSPLSVDWWAGYPVSWTLN